MKRMLLALVLGIGWASTAAAADCSSIADPQARLACFDKSAKAPKAAKQKSVTDEFAPAKDAMARKLTDPGSAQWRDMFAVKTPDLGDIVCGMVNSRNRMGGYVGFRGFIFEKHIRRATLMLSGNEDPDYTGAAAASYCVYCASDARGDRSIQSYCPSLIKSYRG